MLFFRNFNPYDGRLDRKEVVIPGKILVFGWKFPYLEVRRTYSREKLRLNCLVSNF